MNKTACCALLLSALLALPAQASLNLDDWDRLLGAAVSDGHVDYSLWRDNPSFDALVDSIARADTANMSREELLVFYINAYNLLAARGILDGSSPSTLWGRYVYFKRNKYVVAGGPVTLYELEHDLIRPLGEPRIHFAIVCASASCPVLRGEAYRLGTLDAQLEDAAIGFINDPSRNRFNAAESRAQLSPIFDWFEEDFVAAAGSLQAYLSPYVNDEAVSLRLLGGEMQVRYRKYDWGLNGEL
jgi:hypothetical protein